MRIFTTMVLAIASSLCVAQHRAVLEAIEPPEGMESANVFPNSMTPDGGLFSGVVVEMDDEWGYRGLAFVYTTAHGLRFLPNKGVHEGQVALLLDDEADSALLYTSHELSEFFAYSICTGDFRAFARTGNASGLRFEKVRLPMPTGEFGVTTTFLRDGTLGFARISEGDLGSGMPRVQAGAIELEDWGESRVVRQMEAPRWSEVYTTNEGYIGKFMRDKRDDDRDSSNRWFATLWDNEGSATVLPTLEESGFVDYEALRVCEGADGERIVVGMRTTFGGEFMSRTQELVRWFPDRLPERIEVPQGEAGFPDDASFVLELRFASRDGTLLLGAWTARAPFGAHEHGAHDEDAAHGEDEDHDERVWTRGGFIWTEEDGMRDVRAYLDGLGIEIPGDRVVELLTASDDERTFYAESSAYEHRESERTGAMILMLPEE